MMSMHLQLISIDLLAALPRLALTFAVLFTGLYLVPKSYSESEQISAERLSLYSDSQLIASSIYADNASYASALRISLGIADAYGANATLNLLKSNASCRPYAVCSIICIRSRPYLLKVKQ